MTAKPTVRETHLAWVASLTDDDLRGDGAYTIHERSVATAHRKSPAELMLYGVEGDVLP